MNSIEDKLRQEETDFLQNKIRTNAYIEEVAVVAKAILKERNAAIPEPETEEETEEKYSNNSQVSLILFALFSSYVLTLYFGDITTGRFFLLTFFFVMAFRYTLTLRKK